MSQISEKEQASRYLVEFLSKYSLLIELQLKGIQSVMSGTVDGIMDAINDINRIGDEQKSKASAVLVRREDEGSRPKQVGEDKYFQNRVIDNTEVDSELSLEKHTGELDQFNEELQQLLFKVMGSLSNDDVIAQRIEHVGTGVANLKDGLNQIFGNFETYFTKNNVTKLTENLGCNLYKCYTTEEEKDLFKKTMRDEEVERVLKILKAG